MISGRLRQWTRIILSITLLVLSLTLVLAFITVEEGAASEANNAPLYDVVKPIKPSIEVFPMLK